MTLGQKIMCECTLKSILVRSNKHNRLNVGKIARERLVGALINCSLLQSGRGREVGGAQNGTKKFNNELQKITEVHIYD